MYMISSSEQLRGLFLSVGFGFLLGVVYDVFRIIRLLITSKKTGVYIQDILYIIFCAFTSFIFILTVTGGNLRFYILLGCLTGWLVYYFSFGVFAMRVGDAAVRGIRRLFGFVFRIIFSPFKLIFNAIKSVSRKSGKFFGKKLRFFKKFFKILLQPVRTLIYNRFGVFSNCNKKEVKKDDEKESFKKESSPKAI